MTIHPSQPFDVFIIGAGPVGASLALALEGQGLSVGLAEARELSGGAAPGQPSYDDRALSLSRTSVAVLETLSLWPELAGEATAIKSVHVSQRGRLGRALLDAEQAGVDSLGHVLPARSLGTVLNARLLRCPDTTLFAPARLVGLENRPAAVALALGTDAGQRTVEAGLVVGADGVRSVLREHIGITASETDYDQLALAANVTPEFDHAGRAFERFTAGGPLALLPMSAGRVGLVWAGAPPDVEELLALPDEAFLERLQAAFGMRLGRFRRVGRRKTHPLVGVRSGSLCARRAVLVGNAAQTLHPVAAQGFNLGLRDVAALAETLVNAARAGEDPGAEGVLSRYETWRRSDRERTAGFSHGLVRLFDSGLPLLSHVRGLGLLALDLAPPLKHVFVRRAMGLGGHVPRLARGLAPGTD